VNETVGCCAVLPACLCDWCIAASDVKERTRGRTLDQHLADQFALGRLLACISSRPGQCGRCDGYILEGRELEFYMRKMQKRSKKHA